LCESQPENNNVLILILVTSAWLTVCLLFRNSICTTGFGKRTNFGSAAVSSSDHRILGSLEQIRNLLR